ncbi:unnamed protein product [Cunninghamella blakesleeana]
MHNNTTTTNTSLIRKRKRTNSTLKVHFCTKPIEIIDTYSPLEYDRSGLFDKYNQDEFPFNQYHEQQKENQNIILTLSINFIPTSTTSLSSPLPLKQKKKPKLSIDTSNIHGPLYFTNMSTNHQKKDPVINKLDDDTLTLKNTEFNRSCLLLMA